MARRKSRTLTELELEIMKVVWKHDEVTVEELHRAFADAGGPLALPSIRTMLGILQEKGYVTRRAVGRAHAYRALVSESQARRSILRDILERAFDGSALGLVAALVQGDLATDKEIQKVKELIRQHEGREER